VKSLSLLILVFLSAASRAGLADPETGSRIERAPLAVTPKQAEGDNASILVLNQFARCFADQRRKATISLLALPYMSEEQSKAIKSLISGAQECMVDGFELRFKPPAVVGGLAEQMIVDLYKNADVTDFAGMTDEALEQLSVKPRNYAEDFAQCVVRRDPQKVALLIQTKVASDAEAAAVQQLVSHLGPCLVSGQTISLNKPSVRSILAVGLYRMLAGAPSAQAAK
jgi:hypothetical protein